MKKVFIIVLNFNGGREIVECLNSLRGEKVETVVVDNGSDDGSLSRIKNLKFKIIENRKNLGFAAGCNVGIKYALEQRANAVLLLNQDTVVEAGFLEPLLKNSADIVAPVIKFKRGGEWVYDYGGRVNWWLGRTEHIETQSLKLKAPRPRSAKRGGQNYNSKLKAIDYISGCAMLIRECVFKKIGLLDESFFLYFEDVDFCLRARKAGFKIAVEPGSMITHKLSEKREKLLRQHLIHLKSNFIFINRYVPAYKKPLAYLYLSALVLKILMGRLK